MKNFYFVLSTETLQGSIGHKVDTDSSTAQEAFGENWYNNMASLKVRKVCTDIQHVLPVPLEVKPLSNQLLDLFGYNYNVYNWERITNGVKSVQHGFTVLFHAVDCTD